MLKFIFGAAATGKTSKILNLIKNDVESGKKAVLIIPEQFSFESERAVLKLLGDSDAASVEVLSFSRICDAVERITGGICGKTLTDSDKLILMCRAIKNSADDLKVWGRYKNSLGFAKTMLETVDEFKTNAVSYDMLFSAAEGDFNKSLSAKLFDIATIYSNFQMLLGEKFIDPTERLTKLYRKLEACRYFENKTVYLDSFKGFTGQQFKIIDRILSQADNVFISFTCDGASDEGIDSFTNIRKTVKRIKKRALAYGAALADDIILKENFYKSISMSAVEELLSNGKTEKKAEDTAVTVCSAATVYDEAEFAARTIRRLVRENKELRYRDFVIIARDTAPYEEAVLSACEKNGVSCFMDKRYPLSAFPPAAAALSAIDAVSKFSTASIMKFYKSGISDIPAESLSRLENYTYIWNIDGALWEKEWDMNPEGFVLKELSEDTVSALKEINLIRAKLIKPFVEFKQNFTGSCEQRARAVLKLFESCNAKKALQNMCSDYTSYSNEVYHDALVQSWDIFMQLLNSLTDCMGEGYVSAKEFTELLRAAVSSSAIGVAPQMLDEVTFGAADRIRPSRPKIAFILGANQNIFPQSLTVSGLLKGSERESLIASGITISDHGIDEAIEEDFLVYTNVCCPTERLYISYRNLDSDGKALEASAFVKNILENISCNKVSEPMPLSCDNAPETSAGAFSDFCRALGRSAEDAVSIGNAISDIPELKGRIDLVKNGYGSRNLSVSPDTAEKLFGKKLKISPSSIDVFMRCGFSYFCKYGLRAKKLQPAEFDVMQRGTIVHYVLQRIVEEYKKAIAKLTEGEISELVDKYIDEYLDGVKGYRSIENARMKYLVFTISRSLKEVVLHLSKEFAQSGFEPCYCELSIGGDKVPTPEVDIGDGKNISVSGTVDRLDMWNGYVRIVDYKTGVRKFKLPDILVGQNLQMLIYLYAIIKSDEFKDNKPAGIFYMPSRRDTNDKGMRMDGLAVENFEVMSAMEAENKGEFVSPLKYNKDGQLSYHYKNNFVFEEDFETIFSHIESILYKMGDRVFRGDFSVKPVDGLDSPACKYCDFASVCGIEDTVPEKVQSMSNQEVIELLREELKK